jgi:hypothetical protein
MEVQPETWKERLMNVKRFERAISLPFSIDSYGNVASTKTKAKFGQIESGQWWELPLESALCALILGPVFHSLLLAEGSL